MSVLLARVDDRLIHGQIVVGWVRALEADCLVVANDAVAADPLQRTLLPMAVPPHIKVAILRLSEAAEAVAKGQLPGRRAILLFSSLPDAARFLRSGGPLKELNIGGIRLAPGRRPLRTAVALGPEDVAAARELASAGTGLSLRMVPTELPEPLLPLLSALEAHQDQA
ncbi:MAG TPA: PTS sugar transporter subunit IIB [bacterium]|nr:PTS sugar transporter subunit IIB [bacterium]